jgi:hypothetical protein
VPGLGSRLSGCGLYLLVSLKVRLDKPFPKAVRILEGIGAKLNYVDETERRISALVPVARLGSLVELEREYADYVTVSVKASCRGEPGAIAEKLRMLGFTKIPGGRVDVFLGSYEGRAVEVEVAGRRVRVKVGSRVTGRPRPPVPPGLFTLQLKEAGDAISLINKFIAELQN